MKYEEREREREKDEQYEKEQKTCTMKIRSGECPLVVLTVDWMMNIDSLWNTSIYNEEEEENDFNKDCTWTTFACQANVTNMSLFSA